MAQRMLCALLSIALSGLVSCTAKVGGDYPDAGAVNGSDADTIDETPLIPMTDGITLTYSASVGYGDVTATGDLVVFNAGTVTEDERDYYLVERSFTPTEVTSGDLADYAFEEDRYYKVQGGKIALYKSVARYTAAGSTSTARYNPADLRFDSKLSIVEDHVWNTTGTVAITVEQGGDVTYDETLSYRSSFSVLASEEHTVPEGTHSAWKITGTLSYGEDDVDMETFCAPDMAVLFRDIVPRGSVGRPVTQELTSIDEG